MSFSARTTFASLALACTALLGYGYYLQFFAGLDPCPMCIFQRLCYAAIVVVGVIAAFHGPARTGTLVYSAILAGFAIVGAAIAARQTWLQHLPPELVPECGPGLDFMLEMYPLFETIKKSLQGTGDCAEVSWRFLTLSIAEWSLVCFIVLTIVAVGCFLSAWRSNRGPGGRAASALR